MGMMKTPSMTLHHKMARIWTYNGFWSQHRMTLNRIPNCPRIPSSSFQDNIGCCSWLILMETLSMALLHKMAQILPLNDFWSHHHMTVNRMPMVSNYSIYNQ